MKIYFAGAIRGGRDDQEIYNQIIGYLKRHGEVLTEHLGDHKLTSSGEARPAQDIYGRDISWIQEADVIVSEVSTPSLGVGYEVAKAESMGKKILCLYRPTDGRHLSAMIAGNPDVSVGEYHTIEEAQKIIDDFLKK